MGRTWPALFPTSEGSGALTPLPLSEMNCSRRCFEMSEYQYYEFQAMDDECATFG